jgi:DNA repair protein RecN (Recombination protein N)
MTAKQLDQPCHRKLTTGACMLRSLYVKDLAIVDEVEVAVGAGLSVVTGETGAGKSLLVDALVLLSGGRADAGVVRHGCERAELSAEFDISANPGLLDWLRDEELDDGQGCQLRRVIRSEGSSRAWINGRPVTLGQMKVLGAQLIEIHGQHEHQALLERARQLALLDAYADHHQQLQDLRTMVGEWKSIHERIAAISSHEDPNERIEWLNHQLAELDSIALAPEDLARLEETHRRLGELRPIDDRMQPSRRVAGCRFRIQPLPVAHARGRRKPSTGRP